MKVIRFILSIPFFILGLVVGVVAGGITRGFECAMKLMFPERW